MFSNITKYANVVNYTNLYNIYIAI